MGNPPGISAKPPDLARNPPPLAANSPRLAGSSPPLAASSPLLANDSPGLANKPPPLAKNPPGVARNLKSLERSSPGLAGNAETVAARTESLAADRKRPWRSWEKKTHFLLRQARQFCPVLGISLLPMRSEKPKIRNNPAQRAGKSSPGRGYKQEYPRHKAASSHAFCKAEKESWDSRAEPSLVLNSTRHHVVLTEGEASGQPVHCSHQDGGVPSRKAFFRSVGQIVKKRLNNDSTVEKRKTRSRNRGTTTSNLTISRSSAVE